MKLQRSTSNPILIPHAENPWENLVVCNPAVVPEGGTSTCTATPGPNNTFTGWTGACAGSGAVCVLSGITANLLSIATFQPGVAIQSVPTLSEWAMLLLGGLMALASVGALRRQL